MALFPKKTYSRQNNEFSALSNTEKENIDPFDELLSSPLKQDVQFQPLSFWGKKVKDLESKKNSTKVKFGLYETSDSDEHSSPYQRKRKPKTKNSVSKAALCPKITTNKFSRTRRNNNYSASYLLFERDKSQKSSMLNENRSFMCTEEFGKNKSSFLNETLYPKENKEETSKSDYKIWDEVKSNRCFNKDDKSENYNSCQSPVKPGRDNSKNSRGFMNQKIINPRNLNFKVFEDCVTPIHQKERANDNNLISSEEESIDNKMNFSESMEDTLSPFSKGRDSFKFISLRRHFNYPNIYNLHEGSCSPNSVKYIENGNCTSQSWNASKSSSQSSSNLKACEDISMTTDCENLTERINLIFDDEYFVNNTLVHTCNENMDKTFCSVNSTTVIQEELKTIHTQEYKSENTFSDNYDFICFKNTKLQDFIHELLEQQNANNRNIVETELSSTSDDTLSEPNDEDTVIRIVPETETDSVLKQGFDMEKEIICSASPTSGVSQLTTKISDLTISNPTVDELSESDAGKLSILQDDSNLADKENSFSIDLRNVTTKRRGFLNNRYVENVSCADDGRSTIAPHLIQNENNSEIEFDFDQAIELPRVTDRMSFDWNKTVSFANPIFESTRVADMSVTDKKVSQGQTYLSESTLEESVLERTYALKPGKKWFRSMSVLKQLQNGNISEGRLESTRITGRKFESFVQDMLEMQCAKTRMSNKTFGKTNAEYSFSNCLSENQKLLNIENSPSDSSEVKKFFSFNDSILSESVADKTVAEKVLLNRTVKIVQPEEGSSAFRSALGLETSRVAISEDSGREESSYISARNFILIQCGQEDVLPFEEYFNEKTLINCKKIGEGVYGEVFMCSDTVIKIIPIEGLDKVNGEPQKTFEEIISEVVIASKLSNLRNGEKHRTNGFSEMKRCWCVKGKYPKHLLQLWNEFDLLGSGSENDSPVMFKDDQLYIILELANGGKDLESFVFSSASQSLSVFIQAAFSLAVAEKAFEFEHRDLHWGNVLVSETKDKFMTVVLDNTEYKIPTKGVKVCIIDFTLSRINHEGCCIFNDLSVDPGLFESEGDYQFEIYRMMLKEVKNDWSLFRPKNNLFWLHYMLDKMIKMVRYKNKKAKVHTKHVKDLKTLESVVLQHKDSTNFVLSASLSTMIDKL